MDNVEPDGLNENCILRLIVRCLKDSWNTMSRAIKSVIIYDVLMEFGPKGVEYFSCNVGINLEEGYDADKDETVLEHPSGQCFVVLDIF